MYQSSVKCSQNWGEVQIVSEMRVKRAILSTIPAKKSKSYSNFLVMWAMQEQWVKCALKREQDIAIFGQMILVSLKQCWVKGSKD